MSKVMKKQLFLFFLTSSILFAATAFSDNQRRITFAIEDTDSFPIYRQSGHEGLPNPGIYLEMVKLMEEALNIKIDIRRLPWKRCLYELKGGYVDGLLTASYKPKREAMGRYPKKNGKIDSDRSFSRSSYYLYTTVHSPLKWHNNKLSNISGHIGAQLGFSVVSDLKMRGLRVQELSDVEGIFRMLLNNRVAAVAVHKSDGDFYLHKYKNLKRLSPPLSTKPYYLLFSHPFYNRNPKLSNRLWDVSSNLRKSNRLKRLRKKYLSQGKWWP